MIKNILKWRKENNTYLTHVCRPRWSIHITMKIDEIGAFSQHYGWKLLFNQFASWSLCFNTTVLTESSYFINFHRDLSASLSQCWLKAPISSICIVICLLQYHSVDWKLLFNQFSSWSVCCKATVLTESSYLINFHRDLSAPKPQCWLKT